MDRLDQIRPTSQRRARVMTALLVAGVIASWLVAALLWWVLVPQLVTDPAYADDVDAIPPFFGVVALVFTLEAALLLLGLALTWRASSRAAGRVLLLVAGILAVASGLLLVSIGTLDLGWREGGAVTGVAGAVVHIVVGLVAVVASLSDWLPGPSLVERMMLPSSAPAPGRERLLLLTAILVAGWALCTGTVVAKVSPPGLAAGLMFMGAQWGAPILAGAIMAGWRHGKPNRLKTLGLASLAGAAMDWLFLLALHLGRYYHNLDGTPFTPPTYVVWWGLMGALWGALGYRLWGPLARLTLGGPRGPRLRLSPR